MCRNVLSTDRRAAFESGKLSNPDELRHLCQESWKLQIRIEAHGFGYFLLVRERNNFFSKVLYMNFGFSTSVLGAEDENPNLLNCLNTGLKEEETSITLLS